MNASKSALVLAAAAGAALLGGTGVASAEATATSDSPAVQAPVHVPANVNAVTATVVGALNPTTAGHTHNV